MAQYSKTSPWFNTTITNGYLDILTIRPVSSEADDLPFTITTHYNLRPDLLAFDLYGTPRLWWVFVQRNMNVLKDPIYDFTIGTTIFLPKKDSLFKLLGL
jgi:hypothetical protein